MQSRLRINIFQAKEMEQKSKSNLIQYSIKIIYILDKHITGHNRKNEGWLEDLCLRTL